MVQIIAGEKGKGKTKILLDKVNADIAEAKGSIVYLDKSNKNMYELNNKIRLINVRDYCVESSKEFIGFVCGIISQDHDLEQMYFDSFLKISKLEDASITDVVTRLEALGEKFDVNFILSVSCDENELDESLKSKVIVSL